jgi:hypothetical protein
MPNDLPSEQPLNLAPVLETFTTDDINMTALVSIGSEVAEQMLEGISSLREHLTGIEPGRYTVGEVKNDDSTFSVKVAALAHDLPAPLRGMRVTQASNGALVSFVLFADQDDGGLMPIDFDIVN